MAKGKSCPSCGETKFHDEGPVRKCSNCGAVGWWTTPNSAGAGKGSKCGTCDRQTVREVYSDGSVRVKYCSNCDATFFHTS